MKKIILITLLALLVLGAGYVFYQTGPSNAIEKYQSYYAPEAEQVAENQVQVTFFGVSTLLFDDGETQILIDGFFSRPALLKTLLGKIVSNTPEIDRLIDDHHMTRVQGLFVTHSHYDHAFDVAHVARKTRATVYGSRSTLNIARGGEVPEDQLSLFEPYQKISLGDFTVQVIPSKHSPDNALNDDGVEIASALTQPASFKAYSEGGSYDFYIQHPGGSIYIKPSPNYIEGALDTLKADVVMLGIGTVGKRDAAFQDKYYAETIGKLKPKLVLPLHWDNFFHPVSDHLVMLPRFVNGAGKDFEVFIAKTKADGIEFRILQGGKKMGLFK